MRIALLGDIGLFGRFSAADRRTYDYFTDVVQVLRSHDYVVGNLETPLCDSGRPFGYKSAHIRGDEANVEILKRLNVGIVNLANNHIYDYGRDGYERTKRVLDREGIEYFGIENIQVRVEKQGSRVALLGYCCYSANGLGYYDSASRVGVNVLDAFAVERTLISNHRSGCLSIASFHGGQEHVNYPSYDYMQMARAFARKAPYVFHGHHPHVIQGIEQIRSSLIAYSLGNFCFDDVYTGRSTKPLIVQSEANRKSFILSLDIESNRIARHEVIPIYAGEDRMRVGEDQSILNELREYSEYLKTEKQTYVAHREELIRRYIGGRRSHRDLDWYLKRLTVNSIGIILNAWRNRRQYQRLVRGYIAKQ